MKNGYGKILMILLLCSVYVYADDPTPTPYLNETSECGGPMGFITALHPTSGRWENRCITGSHPNGGYYSSCLVHDSGLLGYNCTRVYWAEYYGQWQYLVVSASCVNRSACTQEFFDYVNGLTPEELQDIPALCDNYFGPSFESRLPMDVDLDGNGRLDYYDLDSEQYQEYLAYCEAANVEPGDLVDYMYWYQNDIADWLGYRMDINDTDGDGFSDGYETIHGTEVYDGSDYPLGVPDTGDSLLVVGGVLDEEPWRLEQYNDSGYSRGYVYDQGYDPFGSETLSFQDDPDWGLLDSDNDGLVNYAELANGTDPEHFDFHSGFSYVYDEEGGFYYVTGYTEDGAFGDYGNAPTEEEWLASHEDYDVGNYTFNPSEYAFGDDKYDGLLNKTGKIKFDCDNVRPQTQRDYKLHFNLPIPGAGTQTFTVSVMPDTGTPAGAAMEVVRQLVRGIAGVIFSYVFVKHVWLTIRQY